MTVVNRLSSACVRIAARRWPSEIREEMYREWSAELYVMATEGSGSWLRRSVDQWGFALSLAASSPQGPRGWRENLPRAAHTAVPYLALFAVGSLFNALAWFIDILSVGPRTPWLWALPAFAVAVVAAAGVARVLAWGLPLPADPAGGIRRVCAVAMAPLALAGGLISAQWAARLDYPSAIPGFAVQTAAPMLWIATVTPLLWWISGVSRRWKGRTTLWVGTALAIVLMELLTIPVVMLTYPSLILTGQQAPEVAQSPLWFGWLLADAVPFDSVLALAGQPIPGLTVLTVFAVWYVATSRRRRAFDTALHDTVEQPLPLWRQMVGITVLTVALAVWATVSTVGHTRAAELARIWQPQYIAWLFDLRVTVIGVVVAALIFTLNNRRYALGTAVTAGVGMLIADRVISMLGRGDDGIFFGTLVTGATIVVTAVGICRAVSPPSSLTAMRRRYAGIAVALGLSIPALFIQASESSESGTVTASVFPAATSVLVALGVTMAMMSIIAFRGRITWRAGVIVAIVVLALASLASLTGTGQGTYGIFASGVIVAGALWATRSETIPRSGLLWVIGAASFVSVTIVPVGAFLVSLTVLSPALMAAGGGEYPADGLSIMPGMWVAALLCGLGASYLAVPPPVSRAQPDESAATPVGVPPTVIGDGTYGR